MSSPPFLFDWCRKREAELVQELGIANEKLASVELLQAENHQLRFEGCMCLQHPLSTPCSMWRHLLKQ